MGWDRGLVGLLLVGALACTEDTDGLGPGETRDASAPDATAPPPPDAGPAASDAGFAPDATVDAGGLDAAVDAGEAPDAGVDAGALEVTYLKSATPRVFDRFGDAVAVTPDDSRLLVGSPKYLEPMLDRYELASDSWLPERTEMRSPVEVSEFAPMALAPNRNASTLLFGHGDIIHLSRAMRTERGYAFVLDRDAGGYAVTRRDAPIPVPVSSFGIAVAMDLDGTRAAIGAARYLPNPPINEPGPGVVFLFERGPTGWTSTATLTPPADAEVLGFGATLALSGDGRTLVVGAPGDYRAAGRVFVYDLDADRSTPRATLVSPVNRDDDFGGSLALTPAGDLLVVGIPDDGSPGTGVGAEPVGFGAPTSGAVAVFRRGGGGAWGLEAFVKPSNTHEGAGFGAAVAVASDGQRFAVGAPRDTAMGTGVNGDETPAPIGQAISAGAAFVFSAGPNGWRQTYFLKPDAPDTRDEFGAAIAMGRRVLAVGMRDDDSAAAGPDGDPTDDTLSNAGAVYVYRLP